MYGWSIRNENVSINWLDTSNFEIRIFEKNCPLKQIEIIANM